MVLKKKLKIFLLIIWLSLFFALAVKSNATSNQNIVSIVIVTDPAFDGYLNQTHDISLNLGITYNITLSTTGIHDFNIAPVNTIMGSQENGSIFSLGTNINGTEFPLSNLWTPFEAGWYEYYCSYHIAVGMDGWIKVGDAGPKPTSSLPGFELLSLIPPFIALIVTRTLKKKD